MPINKEYVPIDNQPTIKPRTITGIFTRYIAKTLPLAFDESMSYYECLCALLEYINTKVMPALDNNAEGLLELQEFYEELQTYVNDYFKNLDVQEEINNKLDQMVEDGVLDQIIEQYLNSSAIWGFDTIADMKNATNLVDGSFAQTLGYYNKNDGGKALYKIRTITNDDNVDEKFIIEINDTLIAELIYNEYITPEQIGAKHNKTIDDTSIFESAINKGIKIKGNKNHQYLIDSINIQNNNVVIEDCNFFINSYDARNNPTFNAKTIFHLDEQNMHLKNCTFESVQNQIAFENLKVDSTTDVGLGSNITIIGGQNNSNVKIEDCTFEKMSICNILSSSLNMNNTNLIDGEMGIYSTNSNINIDSCNFNMSSLCNFNNDGYYHAFYIPSLQTFTLNNSVINGIGRKGDELHFRAPSGSYTDGTFAYIYNSKIYSDCEQGSGQNYCTTLKIYDSTIEGVRITGNAQVGKTELYNCNCNIIENNVNLPTVFNNATTIKNCKIRKAGSKRLAENNVMFENCEFSFKDIASIVWGFQTSVDYTKALIFKNCIFNMPTGNTNFNATYFQMIYDGCIFKGTNLAPAQSQAQVIKMLNCIFTESNPTLTSIGGWQYDVLTFDSTNNEYIRQSNFS